MTTEHTIEYTVDAQGKRLGRLASEIAVLLMGKNQPSFQRNQVADVHVTVTNASLMDIDTKKKTTKVYDQYSGYPGGLKQRTMEQVIAEKGYSAVLMNAIKGMLPKNKLQKQVLHNITINE